MLATCKCDFEGAPNFGSSESLPSPNSFNGTAIRWCGASRSSRLYEEANSDGYLRRGRLPFCESQYKLIKSTAMKVYFAADQRRRCPICTVVLSSPIPFVDTLGAVRDTVFPHDIDPIPLFVGFVLVLRQAAAHLALIDTIRSFFT